ncbi:hypothetical protein CBR_g22325 [Chara braunii]|uniref:Uncharacterized protein n=1 Tax=Chara braunii TaxID=69332 RepID=A0A388JUQ3_CHABU|nr:hypothetical protein CBR_g22325 [Chara braunii]|eukprot:GBG61528.1 hypothetical protein CBR_g22325 [Chara braunii]
MVSAAAVGAAAAVVRSVAGRLTLQRCIAGSQKMTTCESHCSSHSVPYRRQRDNLGCHCRCRAWTLPSSAMAFLRTRRTAANSRNSVGCSSANGWSAAKNQCQQQNQWHTGGRRVRSGSSREGQEGETIVDEAENDAGETAEEDFHVPACSSPEEAASESEWLRVALHKWLDDEYCPEPTNYEISRRCANAYLECLLKDERDLRDILMSMIYSMDTLSFKESFHGPFSAANAAVDLIAKRIESGNFLNGKGQGRDAMNAVLETAQKQATGTS